MLKTLIQLLGTDAPIFRRYSWMAVLYGLLCGLTMTTLVPVFTHLLNGEPKQAGGWLLVLLPATFMYGPLGLLLFLGVGVLHGAG